MWKVQNRDPVHKVNYFHKFRLFYSHYLLPGAMAVMFVFSQFIGFISQCLIMIGFLQFLYLEWLGKRSRLRTTCYSRSYLPLVTCYFVCSLSLCNYRIFLIYFVFFYTYDYISQRLIKVIY